MQVIFYSFAWSFNAMYGNELKKAHHVGFLANNTTLVTTLLPGSWFGRHGSGTLF